MIRHILALALLVSCPAWSLAAEPIPGETPAIRKLLKAVESQYRTAGTYQDEYVQDLVLDGEKTDILEVGEPERQKLLFVAPDRIRLEASEFIIVGSGRKIWERVIPLEQYIESVSPQRLDLDQVTLAQFEAFKAGRHPIAVLLTEAKPDFLKVLGEVTAFKELKLKDTEPGGAVLNGTANLAMNGPSIEVAFSASFDSSGLLTELTYDLTKQYQDILEVRGLTQGGVKLTRAAQRKRFVNAAINQEIEPDQFVFKPGPYDRKLADFEPVTQQELQMRLIGRSAPGFSVLDLQGRPVSLADYRGKVVMLDFWATTCGPCIMSFPHIEELAGKYAKQPVAILGVNGDSLPPSTQPSATQPAARFEPIARFLKAKKVTYPQLMDVKGQISDAYRVSGIPCVILLDKQGTVRAIHMGYRADAVKIYGTDIDRLLKDETLTTAVPATQAASN